ALVKQGGSSASSAKEAASGAEFLLLMVVNVEQAEAILFHDDVLAALAPGGLVVLMATCPPAGVERIAERVLATGRRFLDAPVSGGVVGATAAALTSWRPAPRKSSTRPSRCSRRWAIESFTSAKGPVRVRWQRPSTSCFAACISWSPPKRCH